MTDYCFQLKGSVFTAVVLELHHYSEAAFASELQQKIAQAPQLLQQSPIVLNVDKCVDDVCRMTVRRVDCHDIYAGVDQHVATFERIRTHTDRRANAEPPIRIFARVRMIQSLLDIFDRDQTNQLVLCINHGELFNTMLVEQLLGFTHGDALLRGHEAL